MVKLISLELRRVPLLGHLVGIVVANLLIALVSIIASALLSGNASTSAAVGLPATPPDTLTLATMLVRATLIVWEAVLASQVVIEEYRAGTLALLFVSPVPRGRILAAKVLLVCGITLALYALSYWFQSACVAVAGNYLPYVSGHNVDPVRDTTAIVSAIAVGLAPLLVGALSRSVIATVVSSFALVAVASNAQGAGASLLSVPFAALFIGMAGTVCTAAAVHRIVSADSAK